MKTFVVIVIVLAIIYIIIREYLDILTRPRKNIESEVKERELTIEEIMEGKPIYLVYAELDDKELEDLTDNELSVLYGLTKWYEANPPTSN